MSRFFASLLAIVLRGAPPRNSTRAPGRARRYLTRALEGAAARAIEVTVRSRSVARRPRFAWPGEITIASATEQIIVPGTWALEWQPSAGTDRSGASMAVDAPSFRDHAAWAHYMRRLVTLQLPGTQLRVQRNNANGWDTLEVRVPTRPTTAVEFDRDALQQLLGDANATVTLRAFD
ncbi:hypothetical protein [Gemmatimonas phototrophica]|uniref:Uncharacterized protein n=1 Tax=Gemmatimonas phototrophica TaxID=1379270 RepID=A0A143BIR8_9BACT|nr:hypothetical protein [Gemmatimonas phototrophica]AMW04493.1 hypothetical protein GEMMAAP_05820 [Gemmatimonas phototrophica]